MAKNQSSSGNPNGPCEKIYKATLSTIHRIAHCPKNNVPNHPTAKANVSSTKPIAYRETPTAASVEIPIEFDPRLEVLAIQRAGKENKDKVSGPVQKVTPFSPKLEPHQIQGHVPVKVIPLEDGKKLTEQQTFNDKVSNYIDRVKNKMRTTSNVGRGKKSFSRRDSFNDRVSNYINRANHKLKTSSTIKSNED